MKPNQKPRRPGKFTPKKTRPVRKIENEDVYPSIERSRPTAHELKRDKYNPEHHIPSVPHDFVAFPEDVMAEQPKKVLFRPNKNQVTGLDKTRKKDQVSMMAPRGGVHTAIKPPQRYSAANDLPVSNIELPSRMNPDFTIPVEHNPYDRSKTKYDNQTDLDAKRYDDEHHVEVVDDAFLQSNNRNLGQDEPTIRTAKTRTDHRVSFIDERPELDAYGRLKDTNSRYNTSSGGGEIPKNLPQVEVDSSGANLLDGIKLIQTDDGMYNYYPMPEGVPIVKLADADNISHPKHDVNNTNKPTRMAREGLDYTVETEGIVYNYHPVKQQNELINDGSNRVRGEYTVNVEDDDQINHIKSKSTIRRRNEKSNSRNAKISPNVTISGRDNNYESYDTHDFDRNIDDRELDAGRAPRIIQAVQNAEYYQPNNSMDTRHHDTISNGRHARSSPNAWTGVDGENRHKLNNYTRSNPTSIYQGAPRSNLDHQQRIDDHNEFEKSKIRATRLISQQASQNGYGGSSKVRGEDRGAISQLRGQYKQTNIPNQSVVHDSYQGRILDVNHYQSSRNQDNYRQPHISNNPIDTNNYHGPTEVNQYQSSRNQDNYRQPDISNRFIGANNYQGPIGDVNQYRSTRNNYRQSNISNQGHVDDSYQNRIVDVNQYQSTRNQDNYRDNGAQAVQRESPTPYMIPRSNMNNQPRSERNTNQRQVDSRIPVSNPDAMNTNSVSRVDPNAVGSDRSKLHQAQQNDKYAIPDIVQSEQNKHSTKYISRNHKKQTNNPNIVRAAQQQSVIHRKRK
jgi:hypothetical protein